MRFADFIVFKRNLV